MRVGFDMGQAEVANGRVVAIHLQYGGGTAPIELAAVRTTESRRVNIYLEMLNGPSVKLIGAVAVVDDLDDGATIRIETVRRQHGAAPVVSDGPPRVALNEMRRGA